MEKQPATTVLIGIKQRKKREADKANRFFRSYYLGVLKGDAVSP